MPAQPTGPGNQASSVVQQVDCRPWKAALQAELRPRDDSPPLEGGQGGQEGQLSCAILENANLGGSGIRENSEPRQIVGALTSSATWQMTNHPPNPEP